MAYILSEDYKPTLELLIKANQLSEKKDFDGALAAYNELIGIMGETSEVLAAQAMCYFRSAFEHNKDIRQNYAKMVAAMQKAISLSPNDSSLYNMLAWYYIWGTVNYEKAIEMYRKSLELNPDNLEALVGAAGLYDYPEEVIELDEATGYLERAVKVAPAEQDNWYNLASFYGKAGRIEEAEKALTRSLLSQNKVDSDAVINDWLEPEE